MHSHDKIAVRLVQILRKLNDGARLGIDELVEEFSVNKRTILRDFERLSFLPIEKKNGKYFLAEYALGKLSYKDIRSFAILSGVKSLFPDFDDNFIVDLLNQKVNSAYLVKNQGFGELNLSRREFEDLGAAVARRCLVECEYNGKKRTLKPYKLINNNGIWYLLADDEGRLKNFAILKIGALKFSQTTFEPNAEFLERIEKNDTNWFSNESFEVELEIKNEAREFFERRKILPNYEIISQDESAFVIRTKVAYDDEILRVVKYWLPFIKIVSPVRLREKFEEILRRYLQTS